MRRTLVAGVASVVGALALAAPATAGIQEETESLGETGGLEYLRTKYLDVFTQTGPVTECDSGDFSTGGGASISGSGETSHLNSSAPMNPGQGWIAEGRTSTSTSRTVTGWAICGGFETGQVAATENLDEGGYINAAPSCPVGIPLTAGVEADGGDILINGLFPRSPSWLYSFENVGPGSATGRGSAVCAAVTRKLRKESREVSRDRAAKVVAACREGEVVAGGGLKVTRDGVWQHSVWALATRPWDSKDDVDLIPEDGWYVKSWNGTSKTVELTAYATCLTP